MGRVGRRLRCRAPRRHRRRAGGGTSTTASRRRRSPSRVRPPARSGRRTRLATPASPYSRHSRGSRSCAARRSENPCAARAARRGWAWLGRRYRQARASHASPPRRIAGYGGCRRNVARRQRCGRRLPAASCGRRPTPACRDRGCRAASPRQASSEVCIIRRFAKRARSSVGEHPLHTRGVVGSIPTVPISVAL